MIVHILPLIIAFFLDLAFGDPRWMPHPIRLIGKAIEIGEMFFRKVFPDTDRGKLIAGVFLGITVPLITFIISGAIVAAAYHIHTGLGIAIETVMCYQILAVKSLRDESMKVHHQLEKGNLDGARYAVSMIVGRDTERLDESGIAKAAVETVAENTSDGTVAPMLFMAIGGAPLGFLYKAINTLDSMVGYKNDKYLYLGRFSAKLDDVANFLPARISGIIMIAASWLLRMDYRNAYKIFRRDRFNHASPNSAQTEAVCAGALDIQLAGDAWYFGKRYEKKTIGDPIRPVSYEDIAASNRLLYGTAALCMIVSLAVRAAIYLMIGA